MARKPPGSVFKRCGCRRGRAGLRLGASCPRLAEEEHGSWFFSLELPRHAGGGRRRIRRGGYASREEAERALSRLQVSGGRALTVADWLEIWLTTRTRVRDKTLRGYTAHVRLHLVPHLGQVLLSELDTGHLDRAFTALLRQDGVTAATVHRVLATLRSALNAAVREKLIADNPARYLQLPPARRPHAVVWTPRRVKEWRRTGVRPAVAVWTPAQTAQFLDFISDHWLYAAFHLIALRGLRRGEAAGLRWCDIDLDNKVAYISWQIQYVSGALVLCPLKTATSRRVLALDATTVHALRRYRDEQERWYRAHGRIPSGYVFTALDGGPMSPDYLTATFTQLVKASGLPPVRLHDLRHGAASLALAAGVDLKVVADQLGHCSIVLTADTYVSVALELALSAAEAVARLVLRAGKRPPGGGRIRKPSAPPRAVVAAA
jgi:integrase